MTIKKSMPHAELKIEKHAAQCDYCQVFEQRISISTVLGGIRFLYVKPLV